MDTVWTQSHLSRVSQGKAICAAQNRFGLLTRTTPNGSSPTGGTELVLVDGVTPLAEGPIHRRLTGGCVHQWVTTTCFRNVDGNWLIAHDEVSVPVDMGTGRAFLDLEA